MSTDFADVMLDLETLGTSPGCVILSIGAVFFNYKTGELGEEFHEVINSRLSAYGGLTVSQDTINWWNKQSLEARKTLHMAEDDATSVHPAAAFQHFNTFLEHYGGAKKVFLWGNGADFDNVILAAAMEKFNVPLGWGQYNNRCYRTLKNLRRDVKLERQGTYHNALDDAKSQALHAIKLFEVLRA